MAVLVLLNNFLHDFSAAGWLFGAVLLWSILRKNPQDAETSKIIIDILKIIRCLMMICLFGIIVFGLFRTAAYKTYEWSHAAGHSQVTLLIVKHVIFTIVFIIGLVLYIRAGKLIGKSGNEQSK